MFYERDQDIHTIIVDEEGVDVRLDKYLAQKLSNFSRSKIKRMIEDGKVEVNGTIFSPSCKLQLLDEIEFILSDDNQNAEELPEIKLDIRYEDEYLAVINKPAGLTVHPGGGNKDNTLVRGLVEHYGDKLSCMADAPDRPGIVHRLDKDTSGLMIIAKNNHVHKILSTQIAKHEVERVYNALIFGIPTPKIGSIKTLMMKSKRDFKKMVVSSKEGKPAITHYKVIDEYNDTICLLECKLETGRTHQIRVHLEYKRNPVIGDTLYGRSLNFNLQSFSRKAIQQITSFGRQALHAKRLSFSHPITHEPILVECPLPSDIQELINVLQSDKT